MRKIIFLLLIFFAVLTLNHLANAQSANLGPFPRFRAFDAAGLPLAGGKLCTYQAGTSTPLATYTDYTAGTPSANPVILDANGEADVYYGNSSYKLVLRDAGSDSTCNTGTVLWTRDNYFGGYLFSGPLKLTEGSAPTCLAGFDFIWGDSTAHRAKLCNNGGTASTIGLFSDNLSVFASTTSAQLAGVLSDETGSGLAVFGTAPAISNPTITGGGSWAGSPSITSPTITSPVIATGLNNNGSGFKHARVAGCTTAATAGSSCNTTVTWTTTFADANYTAVCTLVGPTANGRVSHYGSTTGASIVVTTITDTNVAISGTVDCIAVHD